MRSPDARRVLGYARVSSRDQAEGTSLQDQQSAIRAYAKTRGLDVARVYVEAESAVYEKLEKRDQIRLLQKEVRAGDVVVCDKLDRWSRDPEFTYRSVREILAAGAGLYFVAEGIDPSTSAGDSALTFRVAIAREEHKRIKERMVGTRKLLRDRGLYAEGLPPIGYRRKARKGERALDKNVLQPVEPDVELVRDIFARCVRGESIEDVRRHLSRVRRSRPWDKKLIGTILRNRVYLGEVQDSRGIWIKGLHEAIISAALFGRAAAALDSRRLGGAKSRADSHTSGWLLRKLGRCAACGTKVSASYGAKGAAAAKGAQYTYYYRCGKRCGVRYILVETADEAVSMMALARLSELRDEIADGAEEKPRAKALDLTAKREQLRAKRDRVIEAYTDAAIDKAERDAKLAAVDKMVAALDVKAAEVAQPLSTPQVRRETLRHVEQLGKAWRRAPASVRRDILHELAHEVRLQRDAAPVVRWKTAEEIAAEMSL